MSPRKRRRVERYWRLARARRLFPWAQVPQRYVDTPCPCSCPWCSRIKAKRWLKKHDRLPVKDQRRVTA